MRRLLILAVMAIGLVALVGGCFADAMTPPTSEGMEFGCHTDYYLWVIPVGGYCSEPAAL